MLLLLSNITQQSTHQKLVPLFRHVFVSKQSRSTHSSTSGAKKRRDGDKNIDNKKNQDHDREDDNHECKGIEFDNDTHQYPSYGNQGHQGAPKMSNLQTKQQSLKHQIEFVILNMKNGQKSDDFRKCAVKVVDIESCCPGRYYYLHNEDNHEDLVVLRKTSKSKNIRKTNGMIFDHTGCVMDEQHSYHHHYENNDKFEVDIKEKIAIPKEVLVLNQLGSHPNLPQLICWYAIPGGYTLVLPRYEMLCELKRVNVREIMRGLLNAVRHLHKHGFMHRDIKLSNVAWDQRTQQPILLDFDLVYNFSQKFPTRYAGTQGWEGPELLDPSSNETYTWSVDIYGCGLVLACLMMWGSFSPKHFNQPKDLIKEVFMIACPTETTIKARHLLQQLTASNPKERPTAEEALEHPYFERDDQ